MSNAKDFTWGIHIFVKLVQIHTNVKQKAYT